MPDTDLHPTNGHTAAADGRRSVGDGGHSAADGGHSAADGGRRVRPTNLSETILAKVDAEKARLGWPGPRIDFVEELLLAGLQASASVQPFNLGGQLAATIRTNGAKS
jgi:hypothetical protein